MTGPNLLSRNPIVSVVILTFLSRLTFILLFPGPNYFDGISESFLQVLDNILAGKGVVTHVNIAPLSSLIPHWSFEPLIHRPLGYLLLIGIPYAIFTTPIVVQVFHAIVAALTALLLYSLGTKLVSERAAWWAALAYAVWPLSARFEIAILPDSVMSFFVVLSLWLLVTATRQTNRMRWYFYSGLICGAGTITRPDVLLLPVILVAWILFTGGTRRLLAVILLVSGVILVVGTHTVRNYIVTDGRIVPVGLGNGISMWEGISQFGDTLGTVYGDQRMVHREGFHSWAYPDGIDRDRKRFAEALAIIRDNPVWYAGVMLKRIPVLLTPDWIMTRKFAPSLNEYLGASRRHTLWTFLSDHPFPVAIRIVLILLQYGTLALGAWALWRFRSSRLLWLPGLVILYYIIVHIPTNTEARYFYPAIPLVLLLASHGVTALTGHEKETTADQRYDSGL